MMEPANPLFTWMGRFRKSSASVFTFYLIESSTMDYQILQFHISFPEGQLEIVGREALEVVAKVGRQEVAH